MTTTSIAPEPVITYPYLHALGVDGVRELLRRGDKVTRATRALLQSHEGGPTDTTWHTIRALALTN